MTDLSSNWRGSPKGIHLAGLLLVFSLQPVLARETLSLSLQPRDPKAGQEVTLSVKGLQEDIIECQWSRQVRAAKSGIILKTTENSQETRGEAYTGREILGKDCSLNIKNLLQTDTGNYTLTFKRIPESEQGNDQQFEQAAHKLHVYLQVFAFDQFSIQLKSNPLLPTEGQEVLLTPQGIPKQVLSCKWFIKPLSPAQPWTTSYTPGQTQQNSRPGYQVHEEGCKLRITKVKHSDAGNYTVLIKANQDRQQIPGKGNENQDPEQNNVREYRGETQLKVSQAQTGGQTPVGSSSSLRLSYTAGAAAGVLFGSLTVADVLGPLISTLFSFFTLLMSRFFP